jgi:hypothetical protein
MTFLAVALLALCSGSGQADQPSHVTLTHEFVPDLSGDGTFFDLSISPTGRAVLKSHRWICADGRYEGAIHPDDLRQLRMLLADVRVTSVWPPPLAICLHAPTFVVSELPLSDSDDQLFLMSACVSDVRSSALAQLFSLTSVLSVRATWDTFSPLDSLGANRYSPEPLPELPRRSRL